MDVKISRRRWVSVRNYFGDHTTPSLHEFFRVAWKHFSVSKYAFGVDGGGAGKELCASLTSAITNTLWRDLVQRTCSEKSVLSVDRDGHGCASEARTLEGYAEESWGQEPRQQDDTTTTHLVWSRTSRGACKKWRRRGRMLSRFA